MTQHLRNRRTWCFTVAALCAVLIVPATGQIKPRYKVHPVDEGDQVASFSQFRDNLRAAVKARDGARVIAMTHAQLRPAFEGWLTLPPTQFIGGQGPEDWSAFDRVLRLGGSFTKHGARIVVKGEQPVREFCAPYPWSEYPSPAEIPDELTDEANPWVILGSGVALRARPPGDMRVLTRLTYDLVLPDGSSEPKAGARGEWLAVVTAGKQRGYVSASLIWDPEDYHACFGEFASGWLITDFRNGSTR